MPNTTDENKIQFANVFCNYVINKIDNIRQNLSLPTNCEQDPPPDIRFYHFMPLFVEELCNVIESHNNNSFEVDPIFTWLIKLCLDDLLPLLRVVII